MTLTHPNRRGYYYLGPNRGPLFSLQLTVGKTSAWRRSSAYSGSLSDNSKHKIWPRTQKFSLLNTKSKGGGVKL